MLCEQQIINQRYQLQQKLGKRPARQTWLALDTTTNSSVVIKFLAFGGQMQWSDLKLFEREAQILRELKHPRIPQYRDYFRIDEDTLWFAIVEQHIPGESLQNLLDKGKRFRELEVKNIALELLEILSYLHQLNPPILHRDLKPSNIILGEDKKVYLIDFGSIQDKAASQGASFTVVGTYGYTPIEQFGGRAVAASDLYALGATLIHLLTRTPPADLLQDDLQIQFQEKVEVSRDLASWLGKMSAPTLKERFHSVAQAQQALKLLLDKDNSSQHQPKQEIQIEQSKSPKSLEFQKHHLEQKWQKFKEKDVYFFSKPNFPVVVDRENDPLSKLEEYFTTKSNNTYPLIDLQDQRNKTLFCIGLSAIFPLIFMVIGMFNLVSIWNAHETLQKCRGEVYCRGRVEALEKLSKTQRDLGKYDLSNADLANANLQGAKLKSSNLQGANLEDTDLFSTDFENANLTNANLRYADIYWTDFRDANLTNANLRYADIHSTDLRNANLMNADMRDVDLTNVDIRGANLTNTNLAENSNLIASQIKSACNWEEAIYKGSWNNTKGVWTVDEVANQQYIEQLKQDKVSDRKTPVDCIRWE